LIRNRLTEQSRGDHGRKQNNRQQEPFPACQHVRFPGTIKDNFPGALNGPDPGLRGKQPTQRKQGDEKGNDRANAHKRRDYTTSPAET
jgi:hypothetical protein